MISIQCHRVGEWWSGKPEFENVSDPAGVYIPFNSDGVIQQSVRKRLERKKGHAPDARAI